MLWFPLLSLRCGQDSGFQLWLHLENIYRVFQNDSSRLEQRDCKSSWAIFLCTLDSEWFGPHKVGGSISFFVSIPSGQQKAWLTTTSQQDVNFSRGMTTTSLHVLAFSFFAKCSNRASGFRGEKTWGSVPVVVGYFKHTEQFPTIGKKASDGHTSTCSDSAWSKSYNAISKCRINQSLPPSDTLSTCIRRRWKWPPSPVSRATQEAAYTLACNLNEVRVTNDPTGNP